MRWRSRASASAGQEKHFVDAVRLQKRHQCIGCSHCLSSRLQKLSRDFRAGLLLIASCAVITPLVLLSTCTPVRGEDEPATTTQRDPIAVSADFMQEWVQELESVSILRGRCRIVQGQMTLTARQMIIWRRTLAQPSQPPPAIRKCVIAIEGERAPTMMRERSSARLKGLVT